MIGKWYWKCVIFEIVFIMILLKFRLLLMRLVDVLWKRYYEVIFLNRVCKRWFVFECILSVIDYILIFLLNDRFLLFLMCDLGVFLWLFIYLKEEILDFYYFLMLFFILKVILWMVLEVSIGGIVYIFVYLCVNFFL